MNLHKYPKTLHLPWSEHITDDDKILNSIDNFIGKQIVVTEKLDGECTSWYKNYYHARSLDSKNHPSRNYVKALHGNINHKIPDNWRICGENLYAKHSIFYDNLPDYFLVFGIYDENNNCLDWDETINFCNKLNLKTVPVLYEGLWDENKIKSCFSGKSKFGDEQEGYVIRVRNKFNYDEFQQNVAKMVRKNHIKTTKFWMQEKIIPNRLKK